MSEKLIRPSPGTVLATLTFSVLLSSCAEYHAAGSYENPYSPEEVRAMMTYHGALAARFEENRWTVLVNGKWIPVENDRAREVIARSSGRDGQPVPAM